MQRKRSRAAPVAICCRRRRPIGPDLACPLSANFMSLSQNVIGQMLDQSVLASEAPESQRLDTPRKFTNLITGPL